MITIWKILLKLFKKLGNQLFLWRFLCMNKIIKQVHKKIEKYIKEETKEMKNLSIKIKNKEEIKIIYFSQRNKSLIEKIMKIKEQLLIAALFQCHKLTRERSEND